MYIDSRSAFTPAILPPSGVTSNPSNPTSLARYSHLTTAICLPFITLFFLLRTYVRVYIKRTWTFEDVLTTTAWVGTVAYLGIMEATMTHNGGKHAWDITAEQAQSAAFWFNVAAVEYGIMVCIVKLSVLWLYRRVFAPRRGSPLYIAITVLVVLLIGFYGATTLVKIFECSPRAKIANASLPGRCVDLAMVLKTSGSFNFITDYLILFLPVHAVWKLRMSRKKKSLVVFVFTFGLCAPIFATIGFVVRLRNSGNRDKSWRQPEILLWGAAELASGLLCVCFPEFGPLLPYLRCLSSRLQRPTSRAPAPDDALPDADTPSVPRRVWRGRSRRERNGRVLMDSGIGPSAHNGGGRSYRERFLLRGWMDSGIGSQDARTTAAPASLGEKEGKHVSSASTKGADTENSSKPDSRRSEEV